MLIAVALAASALALLAAGLSLWLWVISMRALGEISAAVKAVVVRGSAEGPSGGLERLADRHHEFVRRARAREGR
jgi:hypothetical protein